MYCFIFILKINVIKVLYIFLNNKVFPPITFKDLFESWEGKEDKSLSVSQFEKEENENKKETVSYLV